VRMVLLAGTFYTFVLSVSLQAQGFYIPAPRPSELRWWVWDSPRYRIIYHTGLEAEARLVGRLLEARHDSVLRLLGRTRSRRVPVILNGYSDQGNGFVTTFPFRMELITTPFLGKTLPPGHRSWLHLLSEHEQLHALHLQQATVPGLGGLASLFAPDWNVLINLSTPDGFSEGMAVRLETGDRFGVGRGQYSFFQMQYRAFMDHSPPWTLAQMMRRGSTYTPSDRAYQGGYLVADYLLRHHGPEAWRRTIRIYNALPFLGFGAAVWIGTRKWPPALYRDLVRELRRWSDSLRQALGAPTKFRTLASEAHTSYRNPVFLNDSLILLYRGSVNDRPGLFVFDRSSGRLRRVATFRPTEDFLFSLDPQEGALWAAAYVPDSRGTDRIGSEIYRIELDSGRIQRLTRQARASAPVPAPNGRLWYLEGHGAYNRWVEWDLETGQKRYLSPPAPWLFKRLLPDPTGRRVAAILQSGGRQDLYLSPTPEEGKEAAFEPLVAFARGAVYDIAWAPDGETVYFSADPDGQLEIYRIRLADRHVERLTRSAYGAMEPAVSPDGRRLLYVHYRRGRFELVEALLDTLRGEEIPASLMQTAPNPPDPDTPDPAPPAARPYRAISYLWPPRLVLPLLIEDVNLGRTALLHLEGADILRQWAYALDLRHVRSRLWGSVWVGASRPYPYPDLSASFLPVVTTGSILQEQRLRLRFALPWVAPEPVYGTQLMFSPYLTARRLRALERNEPWRQYLTTGFELEARYRIHTLARDASPNSGWLLRLSGEADLTGTRTGRWMATELYRFASLWMRKHLTIQLYGRALFQSGRFFWSAAPYIPLGYTTGYVRGARHLYKLGVRGYLPLLYVDNGFFTVPLYVDRLFCYVALEHGGRLWSENPARSWREGRTSLALYAVLRGTVWIFPVEIRLGYLYRFHDRTGRWVGGSPIWTYPW
jgi:hypothetical protein